jgi:hypothetical protein
MKWPVAEVEIIRTIGARSCTACSSSKIISSTCKTNVMVVRRQDETRQGEALLVKAASPGPCRRRMISGVDVRISRFAIHDSLFPSQHQHVTHTHNEQGAHAFIAPLAQYHIASSRWAVTKLCDGSTRTNRTEHNHNPFQRHSRGNGIASWTLQWCRRLCRCRIKIRKRGPTRSFAYHRQTGIQIDNPEECR